MKNLDNQEVSSSLNTFKNFINNNFLYIFLIGLLIFPIYKLDRLEENIMSSTAYQESMIYGRTITAREAARMRNVKAGTTKTRPNIYKRNAILSEEKKKYEIIYYSMISLIVLLGLFIYQKDKKLFTNLKGSIKEAIDKGEKMSFVSKQLKAAKKTTNKEIKPTLTKEEIAELNHLIEKFEKNTTLILKNKKTFVPYFATPSPMSGTDLDNLIDISKSIYVLICTLSDEKRANKVKGNHRLDIPTYDWEAIKETFKNYANKTKSDRITLGLSIEAVCFNIFEFGRLSKNIGFKLSQYNMGDIKENDLDKSFEYDFITKKFEI